MFIAESSDLKNNTEENKKYARDPHMQQKRWFIDPRVMEMLIPKRWAEGGRQTQTERKRLLLLYDLLLSFILIWIQSKESSQPRLPIS